MINRGQGGTTMLSSPQADPYAEQPGYLLAYTLDIRREEMTVTRTLINTDDDLLDRARALLGTSTKKDTVNAALAEVVALDARRQFLDDARRGDLADADDDTVQAQAWRR